jgi:MFS family permease
MLKTEKRAAYSLALVYALRMLGLFMILPVFSLYADQYEAATPLLIGLAIGIYGLTQGIFQLPFGFLSDRLGRKPVIVAGLLIFAVGSVVAAGAGSIGEIIAGRALQGTGAIAAAVMALAADLTREQVRLRVMAIIGMSIGASFMLSMILGPIIAAEYGLSLLFWMTAVLALAGVVVVLFVTPQPVASRFHRDAQLSLKDVGKVVANGELLKLGAGVMILHLVLSATFVVFPLVLKFELMIDAAAHWKTYLSVFALSVVFLVPMVICAEKYNRGKTLFLIAVLMLIVAELGLALSQSYIAAFIFLVVFFSAFNFLEAVLPTTVTRVAPADMKGTAMGLFSSAQFFGAFAGGVLGGVLLGQDSITSTFMWLALVLCIWFVLAMTMKMPQQLASKIVSLKGLTSAEIQQFAQKASDLDAVAETSIYEEDEVAYIKVKKGFDDVELSKLLDSKV